MYTRRQPPFGAAPRAEQDPEVLGRGAGELGEHARRAGRPRLVRAAEPLRGPHGQPLDQGAEVIAAAGTAGGEAGRRHVPHEHRGGRPVRGAARGRRRPRSGQPQRLQPPSARHGPRCVRGHPRHAARASASRGRCPWSAACGAILPRPWRPAAPTCAACSKPGRAGAEPPCTTSRICARCWRTRSSSGASPGISSRAWRRTPRRSRPRDRRSWGATWPPSKRRRAILPGPTRSPRRCRPSWPRVPRPAAHRS